jgi:flagellar protein FliS
MALPYQNQMNQYKRMRVETASPEMLILMLYDGAIKNINVAKSLIFEKGQIDKCSNCLIKAQNIIAELMASLNFDIGGDIAQNLFNIYEYVNYTLAQANINKNDDNLDAVIQMLKDLRETWQEVIRINKEKYPNGIPEKAVVGSRPQSNTNVAQQRPPMSTPDNPQTATGGQPAAGQQPAQQQQPAQKTGQQDNRFKQIYGRGIGRKV